MKLSEIKYIPEGYIKKDGKFCSTGLITYNFPKLMVFVEDIKYLNALLSNENISCVVVSGEIARNIPTNYGIIISDKPRKTFYELHNYLAKNSDFYGNPFENEISSSSYIHPKAYIAEKSVIIGKGCYIGPNVSIFENTIIEDDVIIRSGSVIGTEGFEFKRIDNQIIPVTHAGGVLIHNNVEIQANSCVAKSVFGGFTEIGEYTKIDNLIHVAHNVKIGKRCLIAACTMIGGSANIGNDVWIGPSSSISSEITIEDGASITLGSVVTKDVSKGQKVTGNFAIDHDKFINFIKSIR